MRLESFEGPLDLLLHLVKRDEIELAEISIERITSQYLDYIATFELLDIDLASDFIVMAAHLIYLKSRALLPVPPADPTEELETVDPRMDLIRQLVEYKKFKDAAAFLKDRASEQSHIYPSVPEPAKPDFQPSEAPPLPQADLLDLIAAFQQVLNRLEESSDQGAIVDDPFTVEEQIDQLCDRLPTGETQLFFSFFDQVATKAELIVTFLALLEMMKMNQIAIQQDGLLGEISVRRIAPA